MLSCLSSEKLQTVIEASRNAFITNLHTPTNIFHLFLSPFSLQLQHLATFIMDKSESITTVDDAIRKLILLNSKEKIWTQEMLLQVNDKSIRLLDCETQVPGARWD